MCESFSVCRVKSEKIITYVTPQGKEARVTREVYLRNNIPCRLAACNESSCHKGYSLPLEIKNLLIVDGQYALSFWEVFEAAEIKGVVVTLSSLNFAQQQATSKAVYNRIRTCLQDPAQHCILFDNEFQQQCFQQSLPGESAMDYTTRLNWIAAQWYKQHLKGKVNVMLLTENCDVAIETARRAPNTMDCDSDSVYVMNLSVYLSTYHPTLTTVRQLYDSLSASLQATNESQVTHTLLIEPSKDDVTAITLPQTPAVGDVFPHHLPEAALLAGIRSGQFLRGILRVSRYRCASEAVVSLTDASALKHQAEVKDTEFATRSEISISGQLHRNRAVDGDVVVVRLLPRQQWTTASSNLAPTEAGIAETGIASGEAVGGGVESHERKSASLPCGFVVGVLTRNWRDYVCTLVVNDEKQQRPADSAGWVVVTPWDRKIPRVRLFTTQPAKLAMERIVVRLDRWEASSNYPNGHFVQSLGPIGDLETETQTILIEHNLAHRPFTNVQLEELKSYAVDRQWKVEPQEVARRRDLRHPIVSGNPQSEGALVFSIDPPGCQDVDDTLSVRHLPANHGKSARIQLGVHIADVTHFVHAAGNLDAEARRRSTSVYLADRRYDMLPGILSGDICSLWSEVDRYAVSVIWEMDPESFEVLDVWYGRTVIRSSYKMTYKAAQVIADLKDVGAETSPQPAKILAKLGGEKAASDLIPELEKMKKVKMLSALSELYTAVCMLVRIASSIRQLRLERGGLELESVEVSVQFENSESRTGNLEDIVPKEPLEMHSTVAELMIFANHWVARRCIESFPDRSCLRRHPPPRTEFFEDLKKCAASKGFQIDVNSNRSLAASLAKCVDANDPEVNNLLRQLATRAMTNALYFSTGAEDLTRDLFGHYGLALDLYTHFTSPIRRYADIVVHRVLMAALGKTASCRVEGEDEKKNGLYEHEELAIVCRHMNERHWAAQQAQRCSIELFQSLFFRDRPDNDPCRLADAIICQLRGNNGFSVVVPRFGIRGNVCLKQTDGRTAWAADSNDGAISWLPADVSCEISRSAMTGMEVDSNLPNCDQLEVTRLDGKKQFYRIFDHVMVHITVNNSTAHGLGLRLELRRKPQIPSPSSVSSKTKQQPDRDQLKIRADEELIESVRTMNSERKRKRKGDAGPSDASSAKTAPGPINTEEFASVEELTEQSIAIAQLHTPSSFYHRFKRLINEPDAVLLPTD